MWLKISEAQYQAMEDIVAEAITSSISLPNTTPYDTLLLEISNYHVKVWLDSMKIKYFMNWPGQGMTFGIRKYWKNFLNTSIWGFYDVFGEIWICNIGIRKNLGKFDLY